MTYDPTNRKHIRRAEKAEAERARAQAEFVVAAMSTLQGRAWFHDLLSACHIFSDPFTGRALDEAYSKGERNVGLRLYAQIVQHCPDYFVQMMREAQIQEITDERRNESGSPDDTGGDDSDESALAQLA